MTEYILTLAKDYCMDWSVSDAIREVLQNCLDSPAPFEYEVGSDWVTLTSKNVQLPPSTLLLGVSGKRGDPNSVGGFGEGYKVATVVLLRNGVDITIRNGSVIWTPSFQWNEAFQSEMLVFTQTQGSGSDLSFELSGIDSDDIKESLDRCLYTRDDLGTVLEGSRGRVIDGFAGKLYVGGLYVTDIADPKYSYDFKPEYLPLNRDRTTVERWEVSRNTSILLAEVLRPEEVALLVRNKSVSVENIRYRDSMSEVREACHKLVVDEYGEDAVVVEWESDKNDLEEKGYKNVVVIGDDNFRSMITSSEGYKEALAKVEETIDYEEDKRTPIEILEAWYELEVDDCGAWINFEKVLEVFRSRGVSFDTNYDNKDILPF